MAKLTLNDVATGLGGQVTINANNAAIEAALENTLSRDGTGPNQMLANLDMNCFDILNARNIISKGGGSTATVDIQEFLIPGTYLGGIDGWTKPEGAVYVEALVIAGGGGGGGGRYLTQSNARSGGGGGQGGGISRWRFTASDLPSVMDITVGAGGVGGAGAAGSGVGDAGAPGGYSTFGQTGTAAGQPYTRAVFLIAGGGDQGNAGITTSGVAGNGFGQGMSRAGTAGSAGNDGPGVNVTGVIVGTEVEILACSGGAGGGGNPTGNTPGKGGDAVQYDFPTVGLPAVGTLNHCNKSGGAASTGDGIDGGDGQTGGTWMGIGQGGTGGGAGWWTGTSCRSGNGGTGGFPGGGGGGGSAGTDPVCQAGNGGVGGGGYVRVITWVSSG